MTSTGLPRASETRLAIVEAELTVTSQSVDRGYDFLIASVGGAVGPLATRISDAECAPLRFRCDDSRCPAIVSRAIRRANPILGMSGIR